MFSNVRCTGKYAYPGPCNSVCILIIYGRQFILVCQGLGKCIHPPFMELFQLDAEIFITLAQRAVVKGLHTQPSLKWG